MGNCTRRTLRRLWLMLRIGEHGTDRRGGPVAPGREKSVKWPRDDYSPFLLAVSIISETGPPPGDLATSPERNDMRQARPSLWLALAALLAPAHALGSDEARPGPAAA